MSIQCPFCQVSYPHQSESRTPLRFGHYWRKSDGKSIQRFLCLRCRRTFSRATSHPCYGQNKRHKNEAVRKHLCAGVSLRESARVLGLNRKTVARKFLFLAQQLKTPFAEMNLRQPACVEVEFDDLETFEQTKCKPLSVTLFVEAKTRRILDFEVSSMPPKGPIASKALKKYGPRHDGRARARALLMTRVKPLLADRVLIRSDSNPHYPNDVKRFFPTAIHEKVESRRSAVTGQGELKRGGFDPIFSLNHTCAMLRAHMSRLIRKTWNTTKKQSRLKAHLLIYAHHHNQRLNLSTPKGASLFRQRFPAIAPTAPNDDSDQQAWALS